MPQHQKKEVILTMTKRYAIGHQNGICNQEKLARKLEIKKLLLAQAKETA